MKIFLDTANLDELRQGAAWGIVDKAGAHIATLPFKVLDMLFHHPLTENGLDRFLKGYDKAFQPAGVR